LQTDNQVSVSFPDAGGYVSTVTLQGFVFSDNIRGQIVATENASFDNDFFKVFPNPAQDVITISSTRSLASIMILDGTGRVLKKATVLNPSAGH